jgi:predicted NAD/FAD-dependent oxidoreductase
MGYCWSVVVAALPNQGKQTMEKWLASEDKDIRWMMRENLKKNRLMKTDPTWTTAWQERLQN